MHNTKKSYWKKVLRYEKNNYFWGVQNGIKFEHQQVLLLECYGKYQESYIGKIGLNESRHNRGAGYGGMPYILLYQTA